MNTTQISTIVLVIGVALGLFLGSQYIPQKQDQDQEKQENILSSKEAKTKAEKYINENLLSGDREATINKIVKENNLYKLAIDLGGKEIESYLTLDGKIFFPEAMKTDSQANEQSQAKSATVENKTETPTVELFVMSYCPYGTQMEKAILPVVETLGDKIDFQIKFCDYAMHGEKELKEEMRQYCIKTQNSEKLIPYLNCFLESKDSQNCLDEAGVNQSSLDACVEQTDNKYQVTEQFKNKENWKGNYPPFDIYADDNQKYDVGGSPTLVINSQQIQASRAPSALLETICSAFENPPSECQEAQLSSETPSPGFGSGTAQNNSGSQCN